jgi:hypothetical protein
MYSETGIKFDRDIVIPDNHRNGHNKELTMGPLFVLEPDNKGLVTVHRDNGDSFQIKKQEDILKLFTERYNWTYSKDNELDCVFKVLSSDQLIELLSYGETELLGNTLKWLGTRIDKITLGSGRNLRALINTGPWVSSSKHSVNLSELKDIVQKLIRIDNLGIGVNLISPATSVKDLIINSSGSNFKIARCFSKTELEFFHSAYKGPRMETGHLGTVNNVQTIDMIKAYLNTCSKIPSLDMSDIFILKGEKVKDTCAHPGSIYKIQANIPEGYFEFPPLAFRTEELALGYPTGEFISCVSKPYLDLLDQLGDIPYKILDSIQIINITGDKYPFQDLCEKIKYFEDHYKEELSPINLKVFHQSIAGHPLHHHIKLLKNNTVVEEACGDYNPPFACAIQGLVAVELWKKAVTNDTIAIRVDALTGRNLKEEEGYKSSEVGVSTLLTQYLKDNPPKTDYRELISENKNESELTISYYTRRTIRQDYNFPENIGKKVYKKVKIPPSSGSRITDRKIKRLGDLLDYDIPTRVPSVEELIQKELTEWDKTNYQEWIIDLYNLQSGRSQMKH